MKIIQMSKSNEEAISDNLIAENVSEWYAKVFVKFLNENHCGEIPIYFYIYRPDDYKLYTFES